MSAAFKKQAIKQINPDIELYVRKMRQLPAAFSPDADPAKLAKSLQDEAGDLVTPVQQKLLKRILKEVTPKREPVTAPLLKTPRIPLKIPKKQISSNSVSWDELPFAEGEPELDVESTLKKI